MNYNLKRLLGKYDPKLLRIQQEVTWTAINAMAQSGDLQIAKNYMKRQMAQQLATQIPLNFIETPQQDTLQLNAQVYTFSRQELYQLAQECYSLGSDDAKVMPNFSNF
jgi:hypothetical protein